MSELMSSELRSFIEKTGIGAWWRGVFHSGAPGHPSRPQPSPTPSEEPGLSAEEWEKVTDFAHRGIGTLQDVEALLDRLPWRMAVDLRIGHHTTLQRLREEARERARELQVCRARLRERGREARDAKGIRLPPRR